MHRHDPARTGATSEALKLPLKRAWTFKSGAMQIISSAAVVGDTVYFGTRDRLDAKDAPPRPEVMGGGLGSMYAVDAKTGKQKWRINTWTDGKGIGWVDSSPAVVGDRVYFAARDNYFYCVGTDGKRIWRTATDSQYNVSSPVVVDGRVYFSAGAYVKKQRDEVHDDFFCLKASDGSRIWQTPSRGTVRGGIEIPPQFSYTSPAVVGEAVYTAANNGVFFSLDAAKGTFNWQFDSGGIAHYFSPTVYKNRLYLAGGEKDPHLYAVEASSGQKAWEFTADHTKDFFISSTAAANDTVYIGMGVPDQVLYAVNVNTGEEKWRFATGFATVQGFTSSPAVAGGLVIVGAGPETQQSEPIGRLFVLDAKTGAKKWSDNLSQPVIASPSVSGRRVFVGTMDGAMVAYQDATYSTTSSNAKKAKPKAAARPKAAVKRSRR